MNKINFNKCTSIVVIVEKIVVALVTPNISGYDNMYVYTHIHT